MRVVDWLKSLWSKRSGLGPASHVGGLGWWGIGAADENDSGETIDEDSALKIAAFWLGVRIYAEAVGSLPCQMYAGAPGTVAGRAVDHPLERITQLAPNYEQTPAVFFETQQSRAIIYGNAYAEIERDGAGRPVALWPIHPAICTPWRDLSTWELSYRVVTAAGKYTIDPADMVHVPGLGWNGVQGYGVVQYALNSLGMTKAAERYGARLFKQGGTPAGVLTHPGELGPKGVETLRNDWERIHSGSGNAHRIAILEEGMKFDKTGVTPEEAQFLELRQFQIVEIARWLNLPPHMLRDLSRATFSNIEQQSAEFITYSLRPWLVKWEQELRRKLLSPAEQSRYFFRFDVAELLRGDRVSRYQANQIATLNGWKCADEVRAEEYLPPLADGAGQVYYRPANVVPVGTVPAV